MEPFRDHAVIGILNVSVESVIFHVSDFKSGPESAGIVSSWLYGACKFEYPNDWKRMGPFRDHAVVRILKVSVTFAMFQLFPISTVALKPSGACHT